jgi:pimeloyl-ACP methyl ester carboxylesterase
MGEGQLKKHHILCIHGIGSHEVDWVRTKRGNEQSFEEVFKEKWQELSLKNFVERVHLHSIHYDDEINKIFTSWEEHAAQLQKQLASSPLLKDQAAWFTDKVDAASRARDESHWGYTHLMDLLLFVGSPTLQSRLVNYVGKQVIDLINAHKKDHFSVIGHSMGCAMAHKLIQALFNEGVQMPDGRRETLKGDFVFQNICMVANTSYALSRDRDTHYTGTIVRPSMTVGEGCCYTWLNVNHALDPVAQFQRFDYRKDPHWLDPRIEGRRWHRDVRTKLFSSWDIHALTHYFRDPEFHLAYFELAFDAEFDDEALGKATDRFLKSTPQGQFKTLASHLKALDTSNLESFRAFCEALEQFRDVIRDFQ